ncbi:MAG: 3-coathanger stack domain-containing protein [Bacteroidota bacterium]
MKNKQSILYALTFSFLIACAPEPPQPPTPQSLPAPVGEIDLYENHREGEGKGDARRAWWEVKHRAAPGVDWREVEQDNMLDRYRNKQKLRKQGLAKFPQETFANGSLIGSWFERGSIDQAGSLREIDFAATTESIYGISDGGTIWRSNLDGSNWTPLNDDIRFDPRIMNVIPNGNGGNRLLASVGKEIHYSDDEGVNWTPSAGFNFYNDWGNPKRMYALNDDQTLYYLVKTWNNSSWGASVFLYHSNDAGLNFQRIATYQQNEDERLDIWSPYNSDKAYLIVNGSTLYELNGSTVTALNTNTVLSTTQNVHLGGARIGGNTTFYALMGNNTLYRSTNNGANWTNMSSLPANAWDVGIHVSPFDASDVFFGAVDCYRSSDSGSSWNTVNGWGQYYGDIDFLHADIMDIKSFKKTDGTEFVLVSNHGGIHVSYDGLVTTANIARSGLNISQYYDVRTQPNDVTFYYAGSQDQGHQRSADAASEQVDDFTQVISGDYGQMAFSKDGEHFWTIYPGGAVHFYPKPQTHPRDGGYNLGGNHPPVEDWINPSSESLDPSGNSIYVAGGNINGGDGSYLVELTSTNSAPYSVTAQQFNYDFRANSNNGTSTISAIETSEVDAGHIYVATKDGTFFRSQNSGTTWTKTPSFNGPSESWVTPTTIYASKLTSDLVWFGGSGYSNPGVYRSLDGGQTFAGMGNGLPSTVVNEIVGSPDETMLFAATDAGPYVYVVADDQWYDMMGVHAPVQNYQSVEYVDGLETIRFGTYGRGIWDFNLACQKTTFYADRDGDGFGDASTSLDACSAPINYVMDNQDCNDYDENAYPGTNTAEICDGRDNNCDGSIDEGFTIACGDYGRPGHFGASPNEYITRVQIGNINNSTGAPLYSNGYSMYSDYTAESTTVDIGQNYALDINANFSFDFSNMSVWVDWDKDLFFDSDELIGSTQGHRPWNFTVTPPNDAFVGPVRMRIRYQYEPNYTPDPYDTAFGAGETEDYTLIVSGNSDCDGTNLTLNNDPVAPDTYQAASTISSTGTVANGSIVNYRAGTSITLSAGFHAENGSTFSAVIGDCGAQARVEVIQERTAVLAIPELTVFPNPVSTSAQVRFTLPESTPVSLVLFDSNGRLVKELQNSAKFQAGEHQFNLEATGLASGIYYVVLISEATRKVKKIVVQ